MTAVRTAGQVKRVLAEAGQVDAPPAAQLRNRRIEVVTDYEKRVDDKTGERVKVAVRTGLKAVGKIESLWRAARLTEAQYEVACRIQADIDFARLDAPAMKWLEAGSGAGGDGFDAGRMDALRRLATVRRIVGIMQFDLLVHVLRDDGDLGAWSRLAPQTRHKRQQDRATAGLAILQMTLSQLSNGG